MVKLRLIFVCYITGGISFQIPASICRFSIHSGVHSVVGIRGTLDVQEGNASFIVRTFHSELYVVIQLIYIIE